jgi:hypothetical protein
MADILPLRSGVSSSAINPVTDPVFSVAIDKKKLYNG